MNQVMRYDKRHYFFSLFSTQMARAIYIKWGFEFKFCMYVMTKVELRKLKSDRELIADLNESLAAQKPASMLLRM